MSKANEQVIKAKNHFIDLRIQENLLLRRETTANAKQTYETMRYSWIQKHEYDTEQALNSQ